MNFLRNFLASLLALVVFFIGGVIFFSLIISALGAKEKVEVEENSILHITLDRPIAEYEFEDPLAGFPLSGVSNPIGLVQLKQALDNAKGDDKIKGILLEVPMVFNAGFSSIESIRHSLIDFRESGKFVITYSEYYSEAAYYLSTAADAICIHPEGDIEFNGLSAELMFFKGLFEKLEINPQIFRVGTFKSAVEPFMRSDMSPENEEQMNFLLENIYSNMIKGVAEGRGLQADELRSISDEMLVRSPKDAAEKGLVDHLFYFDQVLSLLKEKAGVEKEDDLHYIKYDRYQESFSSYKNADNEIAVIVASGEITSGEGDNNTIGGEKFASVIRDARKNEDIKAIVLRINSPGGSFVASDVMWREIKLAAEEKPVIASMSDLAASGGYYMAMACDTIVAMPTTITGSIGIFGIIPDLSGFFDSKLGITFDEVKTGEISNLYTVTRPLTDREKEIIQTDVEAGYETFVSKAAEDRNLSVEQIKEVASGRVWTGEQALERKLVDVLGDIDVAVSLAAEKAGVADDYKLRYYPKPKTLVEQLLEDMGAGAKTSLIKEELGSNYIYYQKAQEVIKHNGIMSRMDFDFVIR